MPHGERVFAAADQRGTIEQMALIATDPRIFAVWCYDHGVNRLNVKRRHVDTFARVDASTDALLSAVLQRGDGR